MKTILVTGGSGNLGQAVIRRFLEGGYQVVATMIPNDPVKPDIKDDRFSTEIVDLMDEAASAAFVGRLSRSGGIDAAVLTVGGFAMGSVVQTSSADIARQYRLNFETAYHIARPVFTEMLKQGSGRIFLIGSRPGSSMSLSKGMAAYGLAKSLLFRLAELMNEEAQGTDVVTSVVVPSTIDTPQNRQAMADSDFSKWVKPEAIAGVIHWYCSTEARILREPVIKVYNNA